MALLPTVFVEAYRGLASGLRPFLNIVALVLVLLVIAAAWGLVWWLDRHRGVFKAADLFLAGAFCWLVIGIGYRELFARPGGIAVAFAVFAWIYYRYPLLSRRPTPGAIHFWLSFVCAIALFHPVADFWYRWQGYIDLVYILLDIPAIWHFWLVVMAAGQGVFVVNLVSCLI